MNGAGVRYMKNCGGKSAKIEMYVFIGIESTEEKQHKRKWRLFEHDSNYSFLISAELLLWLFNLQTNVKITFMGWGGHIQDFFIQEFNFF